MRKLSMLLSLLSVFVLSSCGMIKTKSAIRVYADGVDETSFVEVDSQEPISVEEPFFSEVSGENSEIPIIEEETQKETPTIVKVAADWIEETIVPIFGGMSVLTILSVITTVVSLIMKLKKEASNGELIKKLQTVIEKLEAKNTSLEGEVTNLKTKLLENISTNEEQIKLQCIAIDETKAAKQIGVSLETMCELFSKYMSISPEAVESGIAEDANRLLITMREKGGNLDESQEREEA